MRALLSFKGRIPRATYAGGLCLLALPAAVVLALPPSAKALALALLLAVDWAILALSARRLHDRGKSAWWLLLVLVPLAGPIWLAIELLFVPGTAGENRYGADPLAPAGDYLEVR